MKERVRWIDWAKTIGMFLVILGHCHLNKSAQPITTIIYAFHMPLFFYISGILCKSVIDSKTIKKDFKSILIPYLAFSVISIWLNCILSHRLSFTELYKEFLPFLIGYDCSIGPIWFLPALFFCKLFFLLINRYFIRNIISILTFQLVSLFPIHFIYYYNINLPFFIDSAICAIPFFCFGHYSSKIIKNLKQLSSMHKTILFVILLFILIPLALMNGSVVIADSVYGNYILLYYLNAFIGIILIIIVSFSFEKYTNKIISIYAYGSIISLGIHGYILRLLHYYLPKALDYYSPTYPLSIAVLYSSIVYAACLGIIIIIDRSKIHNIFGLKGLIR